MINAVAAFNPALAMVMRLTLSTVEKPLKVFLRLTSGL
jgi:hypothetical protein